MTDTVERLRNYGRAARATSNNRSEFERTCLDGADEIVRLRAAIKQAHEALTKSSLTADERVYDATVALARAFEVKFHSSHQ